VLANQRAAWETARPRDYRFLVGFDRRWHFPAYIHTRARRVPDAWSIVEARGFRPW